MQDFKTGGYCPSCLHSKNECTCLQQLNRITSASNDAKPNVVGNPSLSDSDIKFRLWDSLKKEMFFEGFHVFGEVTMFNAIGTHAYETKGERTSLERYNDFHIMQFTGCKDKNGKDIYEGDFLKYHFVNYAYDEIDNPKEPKWIEKMSYVIRQNRSWWVKGEGFGWEGEDLWNWELSEVIGNVFANPELLEGVQ